MLHRKLVLTALAVGAGGLWCAPAQALTFVFTEGAALAALAGSDPALHTNVLNGFQAAADRFSALFDDPVTVNVTIDFPSLGAGILGSTSSTNALYNYSDVRTALNLDQTSLNDATAVANLPASISRLINRTNDNPNGVGSATPYLDNSQTQLRLSNANAKALGLIPGGQAGVDTAISFSSNFDFDFDPGDGITDGLFDFVGVATHEIGHAMGFTSGVDVLDTNSTSPNFFNANLFTFTTVLDLYRYSNASLLAGPGVIDWTAGTAAKFFTLDATPTSLFFSTGRIHGDGNQASHWQDSQGFGMMDPTAAPGELMAMSANDQMGLDVIGWTLFSGAAAPEPGTLALAGIGLALGALRLRRRR